MRAEEVVERVWPGRTATTEVLGGRITNYNVKVTLDDGSAYVVRLARPDTELLGIDRFVEHEATLAAAAVGVGPRVVAFLETEGVLVTEFIRGEIVPPERMRDPDAIRRVAVSLRAVHQGPPLPGRFDSFRTVEEYRTIAFARGAVVPAAYVTARQIARRIEQARGAVPERPCHNDLVNANFIDDGRRVRIVDWEYAGMGDIHFDLASFATNHDLDEDGSRTLLAAYFGGVRRSDDRALELMRFMSDFREAMWGVVQSAVSDLAFDFAAYAAAYFERLERRAASAAFRAALDP
jgi:thiamine kinase-like enzyme